LPGTMLDGMKPVTVAEKVVWCRCCQDADCPAHMDHVEAVVECVVCGEPCQCVGCAANVAVPDSDD
jgi:hypothetical protein